VVRKSFDARASKGRGGAAGAAKTWAYCLDVDSAALHSAGLRRLEERPGALECAAQQQEQPPAGSANAGAAEREPVVVVGSGPAGLWAALEMAEAGFKASQGRVVVPPARVAAGAEALHSRKNCRCRVLTTSVGPGRVACSLRLNKCCAHISFTSVSSSILPL
jgi:hypothetical protein